MKREGEGRYWVLLRSDLLDILERAYGISNRDSSIQDAIHYYLELPVDVRHRESQAQATNVLSGVRGSCDNGQSYHMIMRDIHIPDDIIERLRVVPYHRQPVSIGVLDEYVNEAIRLWLQSRYVGGMTP
jgi:hypothetical protein